MLSSAELEMRFGHGKHRQEGELSKAPVHRDLRGLVKAFATELDAWLPEGRYKELAMDDLENAAMWAHKSITRDL